VTVHAELEGDLAGLVAFLGGIETGLPVLSIRSIVVQASGTVRHPQAPQMLQVGVDVCGWFLKESRT
jgi:hypothetical protein